MIKFLIIPIFFLMKNQCFICNEETLYAIVCCRDLKYVEISICLILYIFLYIYIYNLLNN